MTVSVNRTADGTTVNWNRATDDRHGYIVEAVDNGRLEHALTALGLSTYAEIATLDEYERAEILRGTAALTNELTRRVRHLTVACRESGMSWGTLASTLTDDPNQRSTARSTYEAGVRQLGTAPLKMTTYTWKAENVGEIADPTWGGYMTGTVTAVNEEAAEKSVASQLKKKGLVLSSPLILSTTTQEG